jgi:hypothetical protein
MHGASGIQALDALYLFGQIDRWDRDVDFVRPQDLTGGCAVAAVLEKTMWSPSTLWASAFHPTANTGILSKTMELLEKYRLV